MTSYNIPVDFTVRAVPGEAPLTPSQALERLRTAIGEAIASFTGGDEEDVYLAQILDSAYYNEPFALEEDGVEEITA